MEQKVPGSPGDLRPDLTIINSTSGEAIIVDVTIPFEAGPEAFDKARAEKIQKYTPLTEWMQSQSNINSVSLYAFVIGSLGSWDPQNEELLTKLQIGPKYARLFRKLCVTDAIKGSLAIWKAKG